MTQILDGCPVCGSTNGDWVRYTTAKWRCRYCGEWSLYAAQVEVPSSISQLMDEKVMTVPPPGNIHGDSRTRLEEGESLELTYTPNGHDLKYLAKGYRVVIVLTCKQGDALIRASQFHLRPKSE